MILMVKTVDDDDDDDDDLHEYDDDDDNGDDDDDDNDDDDDDDDDDDNRDRDEMGLHATDVKRAKWAGLVSPLLTRESTRRRPRALTAHLLSRQRGRVRMIDRFSSAIRASSTRPLLLECAHVDGRLPRGLGQELDQTDSLAPQS
ncbi:hypothetical protein ElyMa_000492000 [Elysia marginata]|uniref:Uncharacterized protein n=1 Tax=Elysia marginata TaxID=1093978 RepID=A0AAV4FUI8_9GAST|nr:hypothetical protein ElyMa_000492000 [Elysia marginata]